MPDNREEVIMAASEGVIKRIADDLINKSVGDIVKYVDTVAGGPFLANPDNNIRSILIGLLLAYEERKTNNGGTSESKDPIPDA